MDPGTSLRCRISEPWACQGWRGVAREAGHGQQRRKPGGPVRQVARTDRPIARTFSSINLFCSRE